jgi:hypothetical protein
LSKSDERWLRNRQPAVRGLSPEKLAELAERHADMASYSVDRLARRWISRVIAGLLALQAASLIAMNVARLARFNWERELADVMLSAAALDALLIALFLLPLAFVDLITAVSMWFERSWAWLWAMIIQGMLLIFCLSSYAADQRETDIYFLMLTCIVLVLYLNTNDVRLAFTSRQSAYRHHRGG